MAAAQKAEPKKSVFQTLNEVNVNEHVEQKNGLSYLSWAWAWAEVKSRYPESFYTIYENPDGWNYFTDGKTCWVKTGVTVVDGDWSLEHIEDLPVMNFRNESVPLSDVTSTQVNKAIQRSLTKAIARHGLGLYIYAGEDLPSETEDEKQRKASLATTVQQVDELVKQLTRSMSREEKEGFANDVLLPALGQKNYKTCLDLNKLTNLLNQLHEKATKAAA